MEAWGGIQRGCCTERKMCNDPRCHSLDCWTAQVTHTVLQERWRTVSLSCITNVIPYGNVAITHSREYEICAPHKKGCFALDEAMKGILCVWSRKHIHKIHIFFLTSFPGIWGIAAQNEGRGLRGRWAYRYYLYWNVGSTWEGRQEGKMEIDESEMMWSQIWMWMKRLKLLAKNNCILDVCTDR